MLYTSRNMSIANVKDPILYKNYNLFSHYGYLGDINVISYCHHRR